MATPNKQRPTRYWSEQYKESCAKLSKQEIRLQEALHEISTGKEDLDSDFWRHIRLSLGNVTFMILETLGNFTPLFSS